MKETLLVGPGAAGLRRRVLMALAGLPFLGQTAWQRLSEAPRMLARFRRLSADFVADV
jgi:hypothetical protein